MIVLLFVLLPILVVATYAMYVWARNRQPTSVESGVDAFRREMTALSPDAAPVQRRPDRGYDAGPSSPRQAPRRPAPGEGDRPMPGADETDLP
ncbi:hypothetical protein [Aquihabitans sp. McL0605]|uniref:hypothetical protein n=1 Tax=Aquihabitans sp. McL0605 TaxID=3415671 RepID=UPI003CF5DA82